jgi:putative PEP-CTERM system histidine kinase
MTEWIEAAAFVCGIGLSVLLALFPRYGAMSRRLLLLILPASLSAGIQALGPEIAGFSPQDAIRASLALIILASAGGCFATVSLIKTIKKIHLILLICLPALLFALLYCIKPPYATGLQAPDGYIALGLSGYFSSLFLLIISVIVLAGIEQSLRSASEPARWELKFLFLGIGAFYAALIYLSSQALLFSPRSGLLLIGSLRLLHCLFLISCSMIAFSWKRSSGKTQIAVSHGAIYSSITLLSIGAYLIASSLIARIASRWGNLGLPVEALIFIVSAVFLSALILGTGFRHRTRAWIRRNIFAGRYDYRQFWLEATERIRSIDPPAATALALADIVQKALGAIDVSVWIRRWNPNRLHMLSSLGTISDSIEPEISGVIEPLLDVSEPLSAADLNGLQSAAVVRDFANRTRSSLLVPLLSSNRIVGVITVGADRSGRKYDWEAREFLRALAGHAAGEFHKSDLLETLVEAKEDEAFRAFSTFLLHDLKNFASTLSLIAQNAPRHQNNPDFQKDAFQSVYDTAEKMKRLCNSLRTFSSTLATNKKPEDLNQIIRSVADTLNAGLKERLKLEMHTLPTVLADAEEVKRVVQNLLLNAREAISDNGAVIVKTIDRGDKVEAVIEDNGKGMSREFFEKELFMPFHTTKSGGLGIGLFQSKKIMEAHRGTIFVESEEGKGTKITLTFPAAKLVSI